MADFKDFTKYLSAS